MIFDLTNRKIDMSNVLECYLVVLKNNEELLNRRIDDLKVREETIKQKEIIFDRMRRGEGAVSKSNSTTVISGTQHLECINLII
jgi:hypothetical protein